jgi:hypothetical protein
VEAEQQPLLEAIYGRKYFYFFVGFFHSIDIYVFFYTRRDFWLSWSPAPSLHCPQNNPAQPLRLYRARPDFVYTVTREKNKIPLAVRHIRTGAAGHGGKPMAHKTLHYRYNPLHQDIICAETAIATLPATVDVLGASRAMIICGPTILRACNVVPRVQEALDSRYVGVYAGVAPHAPVETVEEGVAMAKEVQPDVFISVGGGSTHDTTKAIVTLLAEGGDIHDYAIRFEPPDRIMVPPTPSPKLPILSVPTTMDVLRTAY